MLRTMSSATVVKGELSQKGSFGRWPSFFFELAADGGNITLSSFKHEGGKMKGKWAVTRVDKIEDRPGKQSNRFDVIAATGKTVALSAPTKDQKKRWIAAIEESL
jgi:hypothetical protein